MFRIIGRLNGEIMEQENQPQKPIPQRDYDHSTNEAIEVHQQYVQTNPNDPVAHYKLGNAYQVNGKKLSALDCYRQAIKLNHQYYPAYYGIGSLYSSIGKVKLAIREYLHALRIKPDFLEALYNLALCYESVHEYKNAIRIWQDYLRYEKETMWTLEAQDHLKRCQSKLT